MLYDTSTGWFKEADWIVICLSCDNLFRNRAKINMIKQIVKLKDRHTTLAVMSNRISESRSNS